MSAMSPEILCSNLLMSWSERVSYPCTHTVMDITRIQQERIGEMIFLCKNTIVTVIGFFRVLDFLCSKKNYDERGTATIVANEGGRVKTCIADIRNIIYPMLD